MLRTSQAVTSRAKRAFDDFDKEWKSSDKDKGKAMVGAAEAFFKANEEVEACRIRRAKHEQESTKRHAQGLLRFTLPTEELDKKVEIRKEARRKANEAHCWQSAADSGGGVLEKMLDTVRGSHQFPEVQLELLRPKLPPPPEGPNSVSTSNRFECLGEAAATTTAEAGWNFHTLFMPTADDKPLVALPNPSPAVAFPIWWEKLAGAIEEAENFVEASQKTSEKRNLFWYSKDRGPENIR